MNSNSSLLSLNSIQEFLDYIIRRSGTIEEVQVKMLDSSFDEFLFVVLRLIQTNDQRNAKLFEDWHIVFRGERSIFIRHIKWPRECDKLSWNDPVQITVLDLFIVLILLYIKVTVIVPVKSHGNLKTSQTILDGAFVRTSSHRCISERYKL